MGGGHYTAYVNGPDGEWYTMDDSYVSKLDDLRKITSSAAYVLFYKRRHPEHSDYVRGLRKRGAKKEEKE